LALEAVGNNAAMPPITIPRIGYSGQDRGFIRDAPGPGRQFPGPPAAQGGLRELYLERFRGFGAASLKVGLRRFRASSRDHSRFISSFF
jgi:hypothetical protein